MKNTTKLALVLAISSALAVSAKAAYVNGDLLVGFTGASNDFIFDLGQAGSLTNGETWNLGSLLGTQFGVVGSLNSTKTIFATSADANENGFLQTGTGQFNQARANIATIAGGSLTLGNGASVTPSDTTSWTFETAQPAGTPGNTFQNNYFNPNVPNDQPAYLFSNTTGAANQEGTFTYDQVGGALTFTAVPEPSTYAFLVGGGLIMFALRRRSLHA